MHAAARPQGVEVHESLSDLGECCKPANLAAGGCSSAGHQLCHCLGVGEKRSLPEELSRPAGTVSFRS